MIQNKFLSIPSFDDIELKIKRESLLNFRIDWDDEKEIKALVFLLPGLGGAYNDSYQEKLIQRVLQNHDVACISVNYFCIQCRPQNGAKLVFDQIDQMIISQICNIYNINIHNKFFKNNEELMFFLDQEIKILKDKNIIEKDKITDISISFEPPNNEYQNFGIMQALDCLQALAFVKNNMFKKWGGGYQ